MCSGYFSGTSSQLVVLTVLSGNLRICCTTYTYLFSPHEHTAWKLSKESSRCHAYCREHLFCVAFTSVVLCPTDFNYLSLLEFQSFFSTVQDSSTLLGCLLPWLQFRKCPTKIEIVGEIIVLVSFVSLLSGITFLSFLPIAKCVKTDFFCFYFFLNVLSNFLIYSSSRTSLISVSLSWLDVKIEHSFIKDRK